MMQASLLSVGMRLPQQVWDFSPKMIPLEQESLREQYSLHIPAINVESRVAMVPYTLWQQENWPYLEQVMQEAMLKTGAVAYPHSVLPGQVGAVYLTAHSSPPNSAVPVTKNTTLFELLPELQIGDQLYVTEGNTLYEYQIESFSIISPEQIEAVEQTYQEPELVLITCYPIGSTKDRFVVRAKLVAVEQL